MLILGLDPGLADTGWGVVEAGDRLVAVDYGSLKTAPHESLAERLEILYRQLTALIKKHQPVKAAVEQLFFCNNVKTALAVGQARGVVLLACQQAGLEIVEFTPLQIKQGVTAYGGADKRQVQKMVQMILGLKELPRPDDAADALAAAICAANSRVFGG